MIPHILHQIWHDLHVPIAFDHFQRAWSNHHPDWNHCLWTFEHGEEIITDHYPQLLPTWRTLPKVVQKADLLRYVVLHRYGGVYADMDTEPLKPFDSLIEGADFVGGYEASGHASICNAIIAATPQHPITTAILRWLEVMPMDRTEPTAENVRHVFATTGSAAITPLILTNATPRTRLLPKETLYPFSWAEKERHADTFPDAYAKHYWVSGWYEEGAYRVGDYWREGQSLKRSAWHHGVYGYGGVS